MNENSGTSDLATIMNSASLDAKELLNESFARLKDVASVTTAEAAGPNEKFFPNGVELIYVKVEAGLTSTTKITVEVKIAGPKAPAAVETTIAS